MVSACISEIIEEYKKFGQVKAVAIGGSKAATSDDNSSDTDIYVFIDRNISVADREIIIKKYSSKYEVGEEYFGAGDEFLCGNMVLDMMYWDIKWFEDVVENVWIKHFASNGYTTCFLYTLRNFKIVYDPYSWLKNLQDKINTEYPKELQKNIIQRNMMLLKDKPFASYYEQIAKAIQRNDINSLNHRISAFLASYFDIIFALNKMLHPGEKRLVQYCINNCSLLPSKFEENIKSLLIQPNQNTLAILNEMVINLKQLLL